MPEVRLTQIHKTYPDHIVALRELSLTIHARELLSVLGPSGCGKSTTLRILAGLEQASSGSIAFDGHDVSRRPPAARQVSMMFQGEGLFPRRSVQDNLELGLRMRRQSASHIAERVAQVADLLDLQPLLARQPHELSGGEKQRVALGRVIASNARLVLLDEPFAHVDPHLRHSLGHSVRHWHEERGKTTLLVTHDQTDAFRMGQRVAILRSGVLQQLATPQQLLQRPANRFVAEFVGTPPMNILPAMVRAPSFELAGLSLALPIAVPEGPVLVGVRPSDLEINASCAGQWLGQVAGREWTSSDQIVRVLRGPLQLAAQLPRRHPIEVGESLSLAIHADQVYLFDAQTEQLIHAPRRA